MSIETVHYINMILGIGAIFLQALSLLAVLLLIFQVKENKYLSLIKVNFLWIGFFISFSAVVTSLFYSEILEYVPCFHCWVDRIFILPQAVIFGAALVKREGSVFWSSMILTLFGLINSVYHGYLYYFAGEGVDPCDASGVSCVQRLVSEFGGYVSIPMLAFTGFFALFVLLLVVHFYKREEVIIS